MNDHEEPKFSELSRPSEQDVSLADSPADYTTAGQAKGRALYVNLGVIKFGTADQLQGAAMFLAIFLLLMVACVIIAILFNYIETDTGWEIVEWIGGFLFLTIGVAVGRSGN